LNQLPVFHGFFQRIAHAVVRRRQRFRDAMRVAPDQQHARIFIVSQRPVRIELAARRLREAGVMQGDGGGRICIRRLGRLDTAQPQFLDETALQRQVRPRRIRA
jgi:hypothetical protein